MAGAAFVRIYTRNTEFYRGLTDARNALVRWGQNLKDVGKGMMLLGASILGPMFGVSKSIGTYADEIIKGSRITGAAVESMQELRYGAMQCNVAFDSLVVGIERMNRFIGSLSEMNLENHKSLWQLGLTLRQIKGMRPEDQFALLAERISRMGTVAERQRIGVEIFGRNFREIVPFMTQGARGLAEFNAEVRRTGIVMSQGQLEAARGFSIQMRELWWSVKGSAMALGQELLPAISGVVRSITEAVQASRTWIQQHGNMARNVLIGAGALLGFGAVAWIAGRAMTFAGMALYGFRKVLSGIGAVATTAFAPLRFAVSWITGLIGSFASLLSVTRLYHGAVWLLSGGLKVLSAVWFANVAIAKTWHHAIGVVRDVLTKGLLGAVYRVTYGVVNFGRSMVSLSFGFLEKGLMASAKAAGVASRYFVEAAGWMRVFFRIAGLGRTLRLVFGELSTAIKVTGVTLGLIGRASWTVMRAMWTGLSSVKFGWTMLWKNISSGASNLVSAWQVAGHELKTLLSVPGQALISITKGTVALIPAIANLAAGVAPLVGVIGSIWAAWSIGSIIVTAVGGLVSATIASVVVIFREMGKAGSAAWDSIKNGIPGLITSFDGFGKFFSSWGNTFRGILDSIGKRFGRIWDDMKAAMEGIQDAISSSRWDVVWSILTKTFKLTIMEIRNIVSENWPNIVKSLTHSFSGILGGFLIIKDYAVLQFKNIWDAIATGASNAWQFVGEAFRAVWDPLAAMASGFFNGLAEGYHNLVKASATLTKYTNPLMYKALESGWNEYEKNREIAKKKAVAGGGSAFSEAVTLGLKNAKEMYGLDSKRAWEGGFNPKTGKQEGGYAGRAKERMDAFNSDAASGRRRKEAEDRAASWEQKLLKMQGAIGVPKKELEKLRVEIAHARIEVRKAAEEQERAMNDAGRKGEFPLGDGELTKMSMRQVGGFSAAVGRSVPRGGALEQIASNTKEANGHLRRIAEMRDKNFWDKTNRQFDRAERDFKMKEMLGGLAD